MLRYALFANLREAEDAEYEQEGYEADQVCPNVYRLVVPLEKGAEYLTPGHKVDSIARQNVLIPNAVGMNFVNDSDVRLVALRNDAEQRAVVVRGKALICRVVR